ncbi:glycosyl-transferase for dystroglycan-domain-containing protein [Lactifluus subvellereus]|nr:glycosyl-transferase for dystroglycan-domain-containing protein [Lactifluus subvellereus]
MALMRLCSSLLLAYVFLSCLYTTSFLFLCPFVRDCSTSFALDVSKLRAGFLWTRQVFGDVFSGSATSYGDLAPTTRALVTRQAASYTNLDDFYPDWSLEWFAMPESRFLSKAFSNSMHPMKIFPYFYKASESFEEDDITITTLVTPNRFEVLRKLASRYEGPLSVTVHIPLPTSSSKSSSPTLYNSLLALHALVTNSPALAARADIHLVLSPFPRAFNAWRNLARLLARTTYMLLLDVDFAICTDWRASVRALLRDGANPVAKRVREGSAALVLPAFEYVKQAEGRDQGVFPRDKHALLDLVRANRIAPFHASFVAGHNSTDYRRFYAAKPGEIYKVTQYQPAYEPYVVVKKDAAGWCDERFTGYGGNKAACLFEMYLSGVSFYVLSDHFLIHQSHAYEEEARRSERRYNRKIHSDFKEETCLRYLKRFSDQGILNTTRARNAQEECRKIKGIGKIVMQLGFASGLRR